MLVLLAPQPPDFWPWLRAELGDAGFAPQTAEVTEEPPARADVERLALQVSANIGLAPLEQGRGLSIWLVNPATHRLVFREVILGIYAPSDAPDVIAVHLVETLRATLMDLQKSSEGDAPPPPPPVVAPPPKPEPARFQLGLGGASAYSLGGVGPLGLLRASLSCALPLRFSLVLDGALTPVAKQLRQMEGTAQLGWYWAGVALRFDVTDPTARFRLRSGAGAWLVHLRTTGQASAPFSGGESSANSAVPHIDLGLKWALSPRLGLGADVSAGFGTPSLRVDFAGREVATWGRPLWLGSLLLETALD